MPQFSSLIIRARFTRKLTDTISFGTRIKRELNEQIIIQAKKDGKSRSQFIAGIMEQYINKNNNNNDEGVVNK